MNAKSIREACIHEAVQNLRGKAGLALHQFALDATDTELLRFAQVINGDAEDDGYAEYEALMDERECGVADILDERDRTGV